jgi:1-pyrroline-5-carboxylate dehydrogenase
MPFKNEHSYYRATLAGKDAAVDRKYEQALIRLEKKAGRSYPLVVDGNEIYSDLGEFASTSPGKLDLCLGKFQKGTADHVNTAVAAAKAAFASWRDVPYTDRAALCKKAAGIFRKRRYDLWAALTLEAGKNRFEASIDADEATDFLEYYAFQLMKHKGYQVTMGKPFPEENCTSILKPFGVWAVISPFNFPVAITTGMAIGAVVAGNTVVLKPSSDCPLVGYMVYEALRDAGLPHGVLNFITGSGASVGAPLIENDGVEGFVFTGSFETGMDNFRKALARRPRPYIAEMGGKNPIIVTSQADLTKAAEGVARSAFGYSGQKCSACSRVLVHQVIKAEFTRLLLEKTKALQTGDPRKKEIFMGPVINQAAYLRFQEAAGLAHKDCSVIAGGHVIADGDCARGYFVEPTIVDHVPRNHRLAKEELFLPFVVILEVESLDDALAVANSSEYGLTAGIFTEDRKEVATFFNQMEAGVLYANRTRGGSTGAVVGGQSFVGWKCSGTTGRGAGGPYYISQFMREQCQTDCVAL